MRIRGFASGRMHQGQVPPAAGWEVKTWLRDEEARFSKRCSNQADSDQVPSAVGDLPTDRTAVSSHRGDQEGGPQTRIVRVLSERRALVS